MTKPPEQPDIAPAVVITVLIAGGVMAFVWQNLSPIISFFAAIFLVLTVSLMIDKMQEEADRRHQDQLRQYNQHQAQIEAQRQAVLQRAHEERERARDRDAQIRQYHQRNEVLRRQIAEQEARVRETEAKIRSVR